MPECLPGCRRWLRRLLCLGGLLLACLAGRPVWALALELDIGSLRYAALEVDAARLQLAGDGTARLRIGRLQAGTIEYRDLDLHCAEFRLDRNGLACPRGELRRASTRRPTADAGEPGERGERPPLPLPCGVS